MVDRSAQHSATEYSVVVLTGKLHAAKTEQQTAGTASILAHVPERYCDVDIVTAGQHTDVNFVFKQCVMLTPATLIQ